MKQFFSLFKALRKIEAFFLLFTPQSWRKMPPSYHIAAFVIDKLSNRRTSSPWIAAMIYSIRNGFYMAYHEMGLGAQELLSDAEIRLTRLVLALMVGVVVIFFTPLAQLASPYVNGVLVVGSGALLIFGAMRISISALWASWALLFPVLGSLVIGTAPWLMIFLSGWVLIWHIPALGKKDTWEWYDWVAALPILFFWMMVIKWVPSWNTVQNGYLSFVLWAIISIGLIFTKKFARIFPALQLFFPASLFCLMLTIEGSRLLFTGSPFYKIWRWPLWVCVSFILSFLISNSAQWIARRKYFFNGFTILTVFMIFGLGIFATSFPDRFEQDIKISQNYLHSATWPLWWFIGCGIIMLIRKSTMNVFKFLQSIPHRGLMPLLLLLLSFGAWYFNLFSSLISVFTDKGFWVMTMILVFGALVLALCNKQRILQEWVFWGLYVLLLLNRYFLEQHRLVSASYAKPSGLAFFLLTIWIIWLNYSVVSENLAGLRKNGKDGVPVVALLGALLWLLTSSLWSIYVDENTMIQKEISLELFMGFNFFGISLIIYKMIVKKYLNLGVTFNLPWHWIILLGVGLVQLLQCAEHYTVALIEGSAFIDLHVTLHQVYVETVFPLEKAVPHWVFLPAWALTWRLIRWVAAMLGVSFLSARIKHRDMPGALLVTTACLTSLTVAVAESVWLQIPSMASFWAVVFRPWQVDKTVLGWNAGFLKVFIPYALAGFCWGRLLKTYRMKGRRQGR